MAEENKPKVVSLEEYLLNSELDLSTEKPKLMDRDEGVTAAATAWQTSEAGIRAVIESRAMELRHKILFTCLPVELPSLRERLVELSEVIKLFKTAVPEAERRAKAKEAEDEAQYTEPAEAETVETPTDNSSM